MHTHPRRRRYFTCALKHAQELAEQVKITSKRDKAGTVEMQEQVRPGGYLCMRWAATATHTIVLQSINPSAAAAAAAA